MKKMTDVNTMLVKNEITIAMWFFMYLTHYKGHADIVAYQKMTLAEYNSKLLTEQEKERLFKDGWVVDKGEAAGQFRYELQPKFFKIFIGINQATAELISTYPAWVEDSKGIKRPLLGVSTQHIQMYYESAIGSNRELHEFVIDQINYGKANQFTFMKIDTFINQEMWNSIYEMRTGTDSIIIKNKEEYDF